MGTAASAAKNAEDEDEQERARLNAVAGEAEGQFERAAREVDAMLARWVAEEGV